MTHRFGIFFDCSVSETINFLMASALVLCNLSCVVNSVTTSFCFSWVAESILMFS
jgi:hypothetical protein